jgi:hypothetical protein
MRSAESIAESLARGRWPVREVCGKIHDLEVLLRHVVSYPRPMTGMRRRLVRGAAIALVLAGCGSSSALFNTWRDPAYKGGQLHKVYVIAFKKDATRRRIMEDAFGKALAEHHVAATPSYREFPADPPDTAQAVATVRAGGYDGVLVASKVATDTIQNYVPGNVTSEARTEWNQYLGRYETYYQQVEAPGYTETNEVVRHRVDVWVTGNETNPGHMIWTATGSAWSGPGEAVSKALVSEIVPALVHQKLIPK